MNGAAHVKSNAAQAKRVPFSVAINKPAYMSMINRSLQDPKRVQRFVSAITSAVSVNPALQECEPPTILSGALLGESLGLSPSPQLGQYYLVPFKQKVKGPDGKPVYLLDERGNHILDRNGKWAAQEVSNAQFVLGYKGMIQLALKSGQYKYLNVISVKQGELVSWDPFTEHLELNITTDDIQREKLPTIGYAAMFEYLNGFRKTIYWSKEKMVAHADRFSPAFSANGGKSGKFTKVSFADYEAGNYPEKDEWLYSSFWYKDFDTMAHKTMLRQLISKWGMTSVDIQTAISQDETVRDPDNYLEALEPPEPELTAALEQSYPSPEPEPPQEQEVSTVESPSAGEQVKLDEL